MSATVNEARLPQGIIRYRESGTGEPVVLVHDLAPELSIGEQAMHEHNGLAGA